VTGGSDGRQNDPQSGQLRSPSRKVIQDFYFSGEWQRTMGRTIAVHPSKPWVAIRTPPMTQVINLESGTKNRDKTQGGRIAGSRLLAATATAMLAIVLGCIVSVIFGLPIRNGLMIVVSLASLVWALHAAHKSIGQVGGFIVNFMDTGFTHPEIVDREIKRLKKLKIKDPDEWNWRRTIFERTLLTVALTTIGLSAIAFWQGWHALPSINNAMLQGPPLKFSMIITQIIVSLAVVILIHELGHIITGFLIGWKFVSITWKLLIAGSIGVRFSNAGMHPGRGMIYAAAGVWANLLISIVTALIFQISPETFGHWGPAAALFLAANLGMAPLQLFPLSPDRDGAAIIRYGILLLTKRPDYSLWADVPAPDNPPHDTDETLSRPSGEANDQNHFSNAPTLRAA